MALKIPYHPLQSTKDLDVLLEEIGDAQVVMLGEASHGTSEFYTWRTAISRRLIQEKGFSFIAVEGDWPDCFEVNRYVKGHTQEGRSVNDVLHTFNRWPSWMWANWEVAALVTWLREYNLNVPHTNAKAGFYGLDVYSLWESLEQILQYLEQQDGEATEAAMRAFNCFEPFNKDPQLYAQATAFVPKSCEDEVVKMLQEISSKKHQVTGEPEADFNTTQNALVAVNAEKYYRAMIRGGSGSWNVRDHHMMETLNRLMEFHGPQAKAIVWEHNTHIGDARYTDMRDDDMVNIGQLARDAYGRDNVKLVGFGSYAGSVIAGRKWGAPMQEMEVPEAREDSWEAMLHQVNDADKLLLSRELNQLPELQNSIGHRAIGVVYRPEFEAFGNYVPTVVPMRYDAFLYFDQTQAVHPLHMKIRGDKEPELYPWNY